MWSGNIYRPLAKCCLVVAFVCDGLALVAEIAKQNGDERMHIKDGGDSRYSHLLPDSGGKIKAAP